MSQAIHGELEASAPPPPPPPAGFARAVTDSAVVANHAASPRPHAALLDAIRSPHARLLKPVTHNASAPTSPRLREPSVVDDLRSRMSARRPIITGEGLDDGEDGGDECSELGSATAEAPVLASFAREGSRANAMLRAARARADASVNEASGAGGASGNGSGAHAHVDAASAHAGEWGH